MMMVQPPEGSDDRFGLAPCWVKARLVKHVTDDGLAQVLDTIPLGTRYEVDIASIREQQMINTDKHVTHTKLIAVARGGHLSSCGWFVIELLKLAES